MQPKSDLKVITGIYLQANYSVFSAFSTYQLPRVLPTPVEYFILFSTQLYSTTSEYLNARDHSSQDIWCRKVPRSPMYNHCEVFSFFYTDKSHFSSLMTFPSSFYPGRSCYNVFLCSYQLCIINIHLPL